MPFQLRTVKYYNDSEYQPLKIIRTLETIKYAQHELRVLGNWNESNEIYLV